MAAPSRLSQRIDSLAAGLTRLGSLLSMVTLAALLALVAVSVATRLVFDLSGGSLNLMVRGNIESSSYLLLVLVLAALPVSLGSGFVRVDILVEHLPAPVQSVLDRLWSVLLALFAVLVARLFVSEAITAYERSYVSQDLRLPLAAIYGLGAAQLALFAFVATIRVVVPVPHREDA
ncbi:hypothetical protein DLJ53_29115 [Acuticoccus sediminis]|uniref:TRAP transporter small permease protein n=1 Tax=Acuticoccus sediminis TaxID=2184697 RepID=A0A8B2NQJ3_9HYPH|nr:TRAP transporter small permease subunit [Acuticoccus sediminis]RAH97269.1 hypothetical protein DLJ53_29115 [Acuticoccus sediminis]